MARAKTKDELLQSAQDKYQALTALVASIPSEYLACEFPFEDRDRNIRDVLAHLYEWQMMMEHWYIDGMARSKPVIPAPGFTWRTTPDLNKQIWQQYQETNLVTIEQLLAESHTNMLLLIESHTHEELYTKNVYSWTKTTTLGAYFVSATASHYDWAIKKINKFKKTTQ